MKLSNAIPTHTKAYVFLKESLTPTERAFLTEAGLASDSDIENMLKNIAKELEKKNLTDKSPEEVDLDAIEKSKEGKISEEQINEGLVLTLILASPTLLKLLGKLIDWAYSKLALSSEEKKELEQIKKDYAAAEKAGDKEKVKELHSKMATSKVGQALEKFAHVAHEAFVWPIKKILQGVAWLNGNEWLKKNAEPAANLIYATIMIGVAGQGIVHSISNIASVKAALSSLGSSAENIAHLTVDSLKGKDMTADVIKTVLNKTVKA